MYRYIYILLSFFAVTAYTTPSVLSISINGGITPVTADYVASAVKYAEQIEASALLINLDTTGGLFASTQIIVENILSSRIPVIVFVTPKGAKAASAGAFIALSADILAMAPGTNIGAAHPVTSSGDDIEGDMRKKITQDAKAWARSIAEAKHRNADFAEKAVEESQSISAEQALKLSVIDLIAEDIPDLLQKIENRKVVKSKVPLSLSSAELILFPMSLAQQIISFLSEPNLLYILLLLGILGIFIEFQLPGMIFPALFGGLFLTVVFFVQDIPINWFGALLILCAVIFFIAEIFITSFGILGITGLTLLITGSYLFFDVEGSNFFVSPYVIWLFAFLLLMVMLSLGYMLFKAQKQGPTSNVDAMVGRICVVTESINPDKAGLVMLNGSYWRAYASEYIKEGTKVRVKKINSTIVFVEKE